MKGDFSNFRYRPKTGYISVLKQQGRVDLDSDWNEQGEIIDERLRGLARDILGEMAIPLASNEITSDNSSALKIDGFSRGPGGVIDFSIGRGIAYVHGYRVVLNSDITFRSQADYPEPAIEGDGDDLLVYIEVWGRTISYIDDEAIRESALGGADTCLRKQLVGQVKAVPVSEIATPDNAIEYVRNETRKDSLLLTLKIDQSADQIPINFGEVDIGGGLIPGNLHFRVELHRGLTANGGTSEGFKWSDENAATAVQVLKSIENDSLIIEEAEPVTGESLKEGDLLEISNAVCELHRQGGQMARIKSIDQGERDVLVTLDTDIHPLLRRFETNGEKGFKMELAPRIRRWSGYSPALAPKAVNDLGRGIKATFHAGKDFKFRPGDFWTFAIRDREYNKKYAPQKAQSDGVTTYAHPLAIIKGGGKKGKTEIIDCRKFFKPLAGFPTK